MNLALHDTDRTLVDVGSTELLYILGNDCLTAVNCKRLRKTVAAYSDDSNLNFRYILHVLKVLVNKVFDSYIT